MEKVANQRIRLCPRESRQTFGRTWQYERQYKKIGRVCCARTKMADMPPSTMEAIQRRNSRW